MERERAGAEALGSFAVVLVPTFGSPSRLWTLHLIQEPVGRLPPSFKDPFGESHRMNRRNLGLSLLLLVAPALSAATILDSTPGLTTSLGPATVAITPHPSWQPSHPVNPGDPSDTSAVWISYQLSGYGDPQFQSYQGTTPVVSIFKTFDSGAGQMNLMVWADDTADVYLDGSLLKAAVFTQSTCSGQVIGCLPEHAGVFNLPIAAGSHELKFNLYQVGTGTDSYSNPMGLLFTGTAPVAPEVPEPASFALMGAGLVAIGVIVRRKS